MGLLLMTYTNYSIIYFRIFLLLLSYFWYFDYFDLNLFIFLLTNIKTKAFKLAFRQALKSIEW